MTPATSVRVAIIGAGSMSSTATLMKRYEAPQIAANRNSIGQYRRITGGYSRASATGRLGSLRRLP